MLAAKKRRKIRNTTRLRFCFANFRRIGGDEKRDLARRRPRNLGSDGFGANARRMLAARENIAAPRAYCPCGAKARAACRICEAKRQAAKAHCGIAAKAAAAKPYCAMRRNRRSREPYCAMRRNRRAKRDCPASELQKCLQKCGECLDRARKIVIATVAGARENGHSPKTRP